MRLTLSLLSQVLVKIEAYASPSEVQSQFEQSLTRLGDQAMQEIATSRNTDPRYQAVRGFVGEDLVSMALAQAIEDHKIEINEFWFHPVSNAPRVATENVAYEFSIQIYVLNGDSLSLPKDSDYDPKPGLNDVPPPALELAYDSIDVGSEQGLRVSGDPLGKSVPIRNDPKRMAKVQKKLRKNIWLIFVRFKKPDS
jgi:hypothetical protein